MDIWIIYSLGIRNEDFMNKYVRISWQTYILITVTCIPSNGIAT